MLSACGTGTMKLSRVNFTIPSTTPFSLLFRFRLYEGDRFELIEGGEMRCGGINKNPWRV